ncbi:hypothetical protein [Streptomyces nigrescens]
MPDAYPDDTETLQDPALTRSLLRAAAADPHHLPEVLAAFAVRHMGPAAARSVARMRETHPDTATAELRTLALARGKRRVVAEGSFVGGPLLILVPFAFCAALLSQARTCLELAAIDGRDPTDPVRGAELLVLQGVYEDVDRAQAALPEVPLPEKGKAGKGRAGKARARNGKDREDKGAGKAASRAAGTGREGAEQDRAAAESARPRARMAVLWGLTMRMARLLGLVAPKGETTTGGLARWLAQAGRYALLGAVLLVGLIVPFVWLPYMGLSYSRATDRLTDRATAFYFGEPAARPRRTTRADPAMLVAALRTVLSLLIPLSLILVVLLADLRLAGSRWPVLGIALVSASFAVGAVWQWRRRRKRRTH